MLGLLELLGRAAKPGQAQQGILQALVVRRYLVAALVIDPGVVEIPGRLVEHAGEIEGVGVLETVFHLAYQAIELGGAARHQLAHLPGFVLLLPLLRGLAHLVGPPFKGLLLHLIGTAHLYQAPSASPRCK